MISMNKKEYLLKVDKLLENFEYYDFWCNSYHLYDSIIYCKKKHLTPEECILVIKELEKRLNNKLVKGKPYDEIKEIVKNCAF